MNKDSRKDALFAFLYSCVERDDRAALANLRCALRRNLKHRAWPLLARFGGIEDELKEWLIHISNILKKTFKTYIFFNNHPTGKAVKNAQQMIELLKKKIQ